MNSKQIKILWGVIAVLCSVGLFQAVRECIGPNAASSNHAASPKKEFRIPVSEKMAESDRQVMVAAFENPDAVEAAYLDKSTPNPVVEEDRPQRLSQAQRDPVKHAPREPVKADELYFWEDYSSMRKDAICNPDSAENRAGVVALMKARQRRLGQIK